ncbi:MAG: SLBB domain-containing protein [Saprospiraceae bacterium]|nr:SLBB domain-containing protein [Saprospiraceae bacterium]
MFQNILNSRTTLIILLGLFLYSTSAFSQITEAQARDLLVQRGIPEDTLKARLVAKGYDPDNITPDQLESIQGVILETVKEIEAEQQQNQDKEQPIVEPNKAQESEPIKPFEAPVVVMVPEVSGTPKIYGQEIFRNNSIPIYQKAEDLVASDSYVLGTGDKIGVVGFGRSQFEHTLEINQEGFVQPGDRLPKILLRGLRFGDAKELLFQRYSQYHVISRNEFLVTLTKPRNMTVNVFGEAKSTGAFTLPGINTAFNVISAAGGPTDIGSVRRIKVIRGNETIPLDVYEFMSNPGVAKNYFLQNNDYIHIPVAQKVVTIQGAVTRPMTYELLDNENLLKLVQFAGGAKANAFLSFVQVTRFMSDKAIIANVNLKELEESGSDYILFNGDIVEIRTITDGAQNTISVEGAVAYPGKFERRDGMKISDLLSHSVLKPDARLDFAYLLRYQPDGTYKFERVNLQEILADPSSSSNSLVGNQDVLQVLNLKTYVDPGFFSVVGAVKAPDTFAFNPTGRIKLDEAILLSGGLLPEASDFGYVMRFNPREPKTIEYIHVNVLQAINDPYTTANVEIQAGDQIHIFDKGGRRDDVTVSIFGAVRNPGTFTYGPGMRLADLVSIAGGFRFEADNERIDIARSVYGNGESLKIAQYAAELPREFESDTDKDSSFELQPYDHVYVRSISEYEKQRTVQLDGELKYPGTYPLLQSRERITDLIERAGGLTGEAFPDGAKLYRQGDGTGLVVIDLDDILTDKNHPSNIVLREGDVIQVPKTRDLVTIGGYVNLNEAYAQGYLTGERAISVAFRGEKSAKYYVDRFAAGVSKDGTMNELRVQYADGRVQKTKKFLFFNKYPNVKKGSYITVGPKKIKPVSEKPEQKADWGSILRDTMYQATAVLTLLILVDQLAK